MQLSKEVVLSECNLLCKNTLMETLNIEIIDFGDDYLWGEWDGARITVEYGDEILAYDIEGDCRFLGVI